MSCCPIDYKVFSNLRARYTFEYKRCYKLFLSQTESMLITNPHFFGDLVWKNKSNSGIPFTINFNGKIGTSPNSISSFFFSYFSTVYVTPSSGQIHDIPFTHFALPSNCSFSINNACLGHFCIL